MCGTIVFRLATQPVASRTPSGAGWRSNRGGLPVPSGPFSLERRAFLVALGLVPAAATLIGCHDETPKPLHGPDLGGVDPTVRPQDDLYRHVNGTWLHNFQLPPDKSSFGSFDEASDRTEEQLRSIIDGISHPTAGSEAQQIRDLYDARMNLDDIEKLGITPLQGMFADIDKAPDKPALAKVMGTLPTSGLFSLGVSVDRKNSTAYIASIEQAGLGLGQQYYQKPEFAQIVDGYRSFLERVAQAAGLPDPAGMARREIDLETMIASVSWDDVRNRDTQATYNRRHWADVVAAAPQFDWDSWLAGTTDRPKELFNDLVVGQPSFVTEAGKIWADTDIAQWRDFLKLALLRDFARYLPKAFADANFDFNGRLMAGLQQRP
ncbi:MAG: M13 family peptidase, partial [Mycobacterium sp.]|nr:M13 family peptidase [Mycobacterium sp.]